MFIVLSAPIDTPTLSPFPPLPPLAHSLGANDIGAEGATALAAILKETQITNLGCAAARVFAFESMPIDTATPHFCSLENNRLCGLARGGDGYYTPEGITKLCEGLKGSAVTSLKCAAAPVSAATYSAH